MCLGLPGHCGTNCSTSASVCPSGISCVGYSPGKVPLGSFCVPASPVCDVTIRPSGLSCQDTWANWAQGFFETQCRSCHRHDADFATQADVLAEAEILRMAVELRMMPPTVDLGADRRRLAVWLACVAPGPPTASH
jgi:hypothetical protein